MARQSGLISDSCVIGAMVDGNVCVVVNDGSCSPWVMCSCSVVRGNQIHDTYTLFIIFYTLNTIKKNTFSVTIHFRFYIN